MDNYRKNFAKTLELLADKRDVGSFAPLILSLALSLASVETTSSG
jgi:hypothetical protein